MSTNAQAQDGGPYQGSYTYGNNGQYPSGYGNIQNQFGQSQYDNVLQITEQRPPNKGHAGVLYSHRPVIDHDSEYA